MTDGPTDASSKLRLVLDYLPCEACLSQPVRDQELLCSVCRRLDRDVDVTTLRRVTVILERPTPVVAPVPVPLPPPAETSVPSPVEEPPAVVGVDVVTEEVREAPAPVGETPAQAEAPAEEARPSRWSLRRRPKETAPEPEPQAEPQYVPPGEERIEVEAVAEVERQEEPPEAAPEPPARKRGFSLFRRRTEERPAEAPPAAEEPAFEDVAGFEPRDDAFEYVRDEAPAQEVQERDESFDFTPREERPVEAPAPVDELEDDFLYRPAEPPARDPEPEPFLLAEEPVEAPREEIPVEPAEGGNPWAPPEEFLLDEPAPAREVERAWPNESEPSPFAAPPLDEEEIVETEVVDEEPVPRWEPAPAEPEEEIIETEIVEMEVLPDDEPEPAPLRAEPEPARPAEEPPRRGGFSSLFKRKKAVEERIPAPEPRREAEPAPAEPEPPAESRMGAWAPAEAAPVDELSEAPPPPLAPPPAEEDTPRSDLYRLEGFGLAHDVALARERVQSLSHLSGHDPVELAARTGIAADVLTRWVQVADLAQEVGVPLEAALALVAAGVQGPRGLRDMDARAIVEQAGASEAGVTLQNVKRWKRRA